MKFKINIKNSDLPDNLTNNQSLPIIFSLLINVAVGCFLLLKAYGLAKKLSVINFKSN
jgi:hypothetical protein